MSATHDPLASYPLPRRLSVILVLMAAGGVILWGGLGLPERAWAHPAPRAFTAEPLTETVESFIYLPLALSNYSLACEPIPDVRYAALSVDNPHNPDAENDPGYNLGLLGYELTDAYRGLVDYGGDADPNAPQFPALFSDQRVPNFPNVYRLYHGWGEPITDWPVTMLGMEVGEGEVLHVPESGYRIDPQGYQVLVIYASEQRIAINYTRGDHLLGYTVYVENVCVEPSLLELYRQLDAAGRTELPALYGSQPFGRATTTEIRVVIRDGGAAMDPRSRKDWWRGR